MASGPGNKAVVAIALDGREAPSWTWRRSILEALGNLGDFVGGLAVIVTLFYLATQLRQNTQALRTASRQEIVTGYRDANRLMLTPGVGQAYSIGLRRFPAMDFDDRHLFLTVFNDQALFFQGVFALHETGQLEDETYHAYLRWFAAQVATPGGRAWWEGVARPIYTARMVSAVDARVAEGRLPDLLEMEWFGMKDAQRASTPSA